MKSITLISMANDVYVAAIRAVVRAQDENNMEDFVFLLSQPDSARRSAIEIQEWTEEIKNVVRAEFFGAAKQIMPTQAEINASPIVGVIKENLAAQTEAAKAVIVEEKPAEAPKKTRAKSTPKVVETVVVEPVAAAQAVVTNPVIVAAQAEVAASVTPAVVAEPEVDLSEPIIETPVIEKPEVVKFCATTREHVLQIYPIIDGLHSTWRKDAAFISRLKPVLGQLTGKVIFASKDSTTMLEGFTACVVELVNKALK